MNVMYVLVFLFLVWFSLAKQWLVIAFVLGIAFVFSLLSSKTVVSAKSRAPAVSPEREVIYVPVVDDSESPWLYPPDFKVQVRSAWTGAKEYEIASYYGLGGAVRGLVNIFRKWRK